MTAIKSERRTDINESYAPSQSRDDHNEAAYRRWGLPGYAAQPTKQDSAVQKLEASINNCAQALAAWRQQQLTAQRGAKHKQLEAMVNAAAHRVFMNAKGDVPEPSTGLRDKIGLP